MFVVYYTLHCCQMWFWTIILMNKKNYKNAIYNMLFLITLFLECYVWNVRIWMYYFICLSWKYCSYIIGRKNIVLCMWVRYKYSSRRKNAIAEITTNHKQSLIFLKQGFHEASPNIKMILELIKIYFKNMIPIFMSLNHTNRLK